MKPRRMGLRSKRQDAGWILVSSRSSSTAAAALNGQATVAADGIEEFDGRGYNVGVFVLVVLNDEDARG